MKRRIFFGAIIVLIISLATVFSAADFVKTDGFAKVNNIQVINRNIISVGVNCTAIVATISFERADYIQRGLNNEIFVRPSIYDNYKETLNNYNITLEAVKIVNFEDGIYKSEIIFSQDNEVLILDARPSDAIALAIRTNSPIYINESLLKDQGINICENP